MRASQDLATRFWAKVDRSGDCWRWTAHGLPSGYGQITVNKRPELAHRVAWKLTNGPIPDGMHVCHSCDNPPCVNPSHLWLGTNLDNRHDSLAKGRLVTPALPGAAHPGARLTASAVREMRARKSEGATFVQMASEFGFSAGHIHRILHGRTWIPAE